MGDMREVWDNYKGTQVLRREKRLKLRTLQLMGLLKEGFNIVGLSPYQFRVNDRLDLWLIHNRYHDIETGRRGGFKDVVSFIKSFFKGDKA